MRLAAVALLVRDYDEAIDWFVDRLGFTLGEDSDLGGGKRWVRVVAPGGGSDILLARATTPDQQAAIGCAGGGRVSFFLHTDDFDASYRRMRDKGVAFSEQPRSEAYGQVVVFTDLYGNKWDLVGLTAPAIAAKADA